MEKDVYELTNAQKNIWNTELFYNGSNINNICGVINIYEKLDFDILRKALDLIIYENDNFNINFEIKEGCIYQYFSSAPNYTIDLIDIKNESELEKNVKKMKRHIFNILNSDLFEFKIFKYPNLTGGVIVNVHHLIADSWTLGLIAEEIISKYSLLVKNIKPTKEIFSYSKFIESENSYLNSTRYQNDKLFWENYLNNIPDPITIPYVKKNHIKRNNYNANRKIFTLDLDTVNNLQNFCTANNISLFGLFLAIYSLYIGRTNDSNDFIIGTPILNRTSKSQKETMGMFVNTVPLRINLDENMKISDFISEIYRNFLSLLRHQKYSYQDILEDLRKKKPQMPNLYNVLLSYQITKIKSIDNLKYFSEWNFNGYISDDIDIHFFDLNDLGTINIAYDYKTSKYNAEDISEIHNRVIYIINQAIENPNVLLKDVLISTPKELKKILHNSLKNNCLYPDDKTVSQLFEEQVNITPNNIAVKCNNDFLTYAELNKKSNQLAHFLRNKGVKPNDVIALRLNKSLEMIIAIFGIIKAGGCYLPIDLSYPQERVSFMLKDSSAKIFLTNEQHKDDLSIPIETILLDLKEFNEIYKNRTDNLPCITTPEDLIYIIYTSGSTGTPKGVMLCHRNVVRLIKNDDFQFDFNANDVWTMFHSVAFDFSVWELYGALLYGSKLILVPELTSKDPNKFLSLLRDEHVTVLNQTPTYFYNLLDMELLTHDNDLSIRYIIFGGEALNPNLLLPWKEKYPNTNFINMYGITETTVHVTFKKLTDKDLLSSNSNVGKPIPTLTTYIMDKNLHIQPYNVKGEICVGGLGVCKGYLNRPELNKEKFVPNPYNPNEILFRSADAAILTPSGDLHYIGRMDKQVKIRGFRIEIGEIESKLLKNPNVKKCVVLPKQNGTSDSFLVAYIVTKRNISSDSLKEYIGNLVPSYMIPSYFIFLDKIPVNTNGKVDRKALLELDIQVDTNKKYIAPRNDFEKTFQMILEKNLQIKKIGIDDDILNLGADSLTLMRITIELLEKNYIVNIQDIYEQKTIRQISDNFFYPKKSNIYKLKPEKDIYYNFDENFSYEQIMPKNILLTGSTGYLGIHILNNLINNTNCDIYCLIRRKNKTSSKKRLLDKLSYYFGDSLNKYIDSRIHILEADISQTKFGLSESEYKEIGQKIDLVIHSAAIVDHYGDKDLFELINVTGTNNIIDFCKTFSIYLNHISTTSVSASLPNAEKPVVFDEHTLYIGQNYLDNIYIKTKFEAEYNILQAVLNSDLKASIYRIGNISARYTDGKFQENDTKNAFLNRIITLSKLDYIPKSFANLDIDFSPVDICSLIVTSLLMLNSSYSKIFHIYNNNSMKLIDLINYIKDKSTPIKLIDDKEFYDYIKTKSDILGIINDLTSKSSSYNSNIILDNSFSVNYMKKVDITWPKIDQTYLNKFFKKYLSEKG